MTLRKRRIILAISVLAFLILTPILLLYTLGYQIDRNFRIGRTGGLYVSSPLSGSEIFVNDHREKKTNILQGGVFLQNLVTGDYPVLVTKEDYWPWLKNLEIKEGMVAEARAVLVPQSPRGEIILRGTFSNVWSSPYDKLLLLEEKKGNDVRAIFYLPDTDVFLTNSTSETSQLLSFKSGVLKIFWENGAVLLKGEKNVIRATFDLNSQTVKVSLEPINDFSVDNRHEKLMLGKKQRLWVDERANAVWIEWLGDKEQIPYYLCDAKPCENTNYLISNFRFPVKNADFFPGRRDAVIAAVSNTVFALEADDRGGRLSFPIYKGKDPAFASFFSDKKIYILDDNALYAVNLEK